MGNSIDIITTASALTPGGIALWCLPVLPVAAAFFISARRNNGMAFAVACAGVIAWALLALLNSFATDNAVAQRNAENISASFGVTEPEARALLQREEPRGGRIFGRDDQREATATPLTVDGVVVDARLVAEGGAYSIWTRGGDRPDQFLPVLD